MSNAAEALVRSWVDAINRRDFDAFDHLMAAAYVNHDPPAGGQDAGVIGLKLFLRDLCAAVDGFRYDIQDLRDDDGVVVVRLIGHGRQVGDLNGLPATNEPVRVTVTHRFSVRGGLIQERWGDPDDPFTVRPVVSESS